MPPDHDPDSDSESASMISSTSNPAPSGTWERAFRKLNEKKSRLRRIKLKTESEALSLDRTQQNHALRIFQLPTEIRDEIFAHLVEFDWLVLMQVCRTFRYHHTDPSKYFVAIFDNLKTSPAARKDFQRRMRELLERDEWNMIAARDRLHPSSTEALCRGCRKMHPHAAFTTRMLATPPDTRFCVGRIGVFPICEHEVMHFQGRCPVIFGVPVEPDSSGIDYCHHEDYTISLRRPSFDTGLFGYHLDPENALKLRKFDDQYERISNTDKRVIEITFKIPLIASGFKGAEHSLLQAIVKEDDRFICPHLRVYDTSPTGLSDDWDWKKRRNCRGHCDQPFCLTRWEFKDDYRGSIVLAVIRTAGFGDDPGDPIWLGGLVQLENDDVDEQGTEVEEVKSHHDTSSS